MEGGWGPMTMWRGGGSRLAMALVVVLQLGCRAEAHTTAEAWGPPQSPLADSTFVALVGRISEDGGYFDTDNLISNESGYLKVMGALEAQSLQGGAYVGVGPDQNFSYLVLLKPDIAFITDIRRDNLLHHLLLKALMERSPTRVEFLAALHGRAAPPDPAAWREASAAEVVAYVDGSEADSGVVAELGEAVADSLQAMGIPLSDDDVGTLRRFHASFVDAGPGLRFTTFGRPPRPHYPTYRQLILETDLAGNPVSYLADAGRYRTVREMQLANRIVPVVGDLAGDGALREMGEVMREMGVELTAFYTSNVEFYLWNEGTFPAWEENVRALPAAPGAVLIRSYFPNFGGPHPSAVPGYYATQSLQPVSEFVRGDFTGYWDVVTRGVLPLR